MVSPSASVCTMRTGKALPWLFVRSLRRCRHIIANSHVAKRVIATRVVTTDRFGDATPRLSEIAPAWDGLEDEDLIAREDMVAGTSSSHAG